MSEPVYDGMPDIQRPPAHQPPSGTLRKLDPVAVAARGEELSFITKYGKMFLEEYIPQKNTVSIEEFNKYMPLFNKALLQQLNAEQLRELSYDYNQRFNYQEPVYIISSSEYDEKGRLWPKDGRKHRVVYTLPPRLNKLNAVNTLGGNIIQVAAECLANTRSTSNPFDNRAQYYSSELGRILTMANKENLDKQSEDFKKYESALLHKSEASTTSQEQPKDTSPDADPEGLDADWE